MAIDRRGLGSTYYYYIQLVVCTLSSVFNNGYLVITNQSAERLPVVLVPYLGVGRLFSVV